jgi:hypothetical protein
MKIDLFPLLMYGQFTQNINGADTTAEKTVILGLYSTKEKANSALAFAGALDCPGWGVTATYVSYAIQVDQPPTFYNEGEK